MKAHDKELRLQQLLKKDSETGLLLAEYEEYRELTGQKKEAEKKAAEKKTAEKAVNDLIKEWSKDSSYSI